jgi:hypothetical protein
VKSGRPGRPGKRRNVHRSTFSRVHPGPEYILTLCQGLLNAPFGLK